MQYSDLEQFFTDFVKQYSPYQDNRIYDIIINYLTDHYFKDMYTVIPEDFKTLYEQNIVTENIYNQLLLAIGVHIEVIKKLKVNEKKLFLMALSDFQRIKGSVNLFKKIATVYKDKFNIYELYVDRDNHNDWILRPYKIYTGIIDVKLELQPIPYDIAYNSIPSLLVSEEQLTYYYDNHLAAFPLKTNIISLQYLMETHVSELLNLSIATFLKEYKTEIITIYHKDNSFNLGLKDIFYIWYYLFHKFYNTEMSEFSLQKVLLLSDDLNPYDLNDLEVIWAEYDKLNYSSDVYAFYDKYFTKVFQTIHKQDRVPLSEIEFGVHQINAKYLLYLKERLDTPEILADNVLRKKEFNTFMDEIYDSLLLYQDTKLRDPNSELFNKYFDIFLKSLNHILINPKDTVSYLLMYNFKPYHTEILTDYLDALVVDDKFNSINLKDEYDFLLKLVRADFLDQMVDYIHSFDIEYKTKDLSAIVDVHKFYFEYFNKEKFEFNDLFKKAYIIKKNIDALAITWNYIHHIEYFKKENFDINEKYKFHIYYFYKELYEFLDKFEKIFIECLRYENFDISNRYKFDTKYKSKDLSYLVDFDSFNIMSLGFDSYTEALDTYIDKFLIDTKFFDFIAIAWKTIYQLFYFHSEKQLFHDKYELIFSLIINEIIPIINKIKNELICCFSENCIYYSGYSINPNIKKKTILANTDMGLFNNSSVMKIIYNIDVEYPSNPQYRSYDFYGFISKKDKSNLEYKNGENLNIEEDYNIIVSN